MKSIWVLAIVASFILGTMVSGAVVFAGDDDELSSLRCQIGQVMTGILFEDDDEILDVICETGATGPPGPPGEGLSCENQQAIANAAPEFDIVETCDGDGDNVIDALDNCLNTPNADQANLDGDGLGDVCDDSDGDGVFDSDDICQGFDDTLDADGDGVPDGCDVCDGDDATGDTDEDGVCNDIDICPLDPNNQC